MGFIGTKWSDTISFRFYKTWCLDLNSGSWSWFIDIGPSGIKIRKPKHMRKDD